MGFWNSFMKTLGFEGEKNEENSEKIETPKVVEHKAEFDLKNMPSEEKIKQFSPNTQVEIQNIVDILKKGECVCVNMQNLENTSYIRSLDFLSGAIYVLNGKIKKNGEKTYIFYPNMGE